MEDFDILNALSKVDSLKDFRLRDFMVRLGLDPKQTVTFYRELIKDAREVMSLFDLLESTIETMAEVETQLKASLSVKDERLKDLRTKINNLEAQAQKSTETLEQERQQLAAATSELQESAGMYQAIKEFLGKGEVKRTTFKALSDIFWDIYLQALHAQVAGRPPPDPARLESLRQNLRGDFRKLLQIKIPRIPRSTLEDENIKLRKKNQDLIYALKRLYGGRVDRDDTRG